MVDEEVTLGEVVRSLTRIEARLDSKMDDHERRLRDLEKWKYALPPTVAIAAASVIAAIFQ